MRKNEIAAALMAVSLILGSVPIHAEAIPESPSPVVPETCDHVWSEWTAGPAKSFENSKETGSTFTYIRTCDSCGETESYSVSDYERYATCTEDGVKTHTDELHPENNTEETIPAPGHAWGDWDAAQTVDSYIDENHNTVEIHMHSRFCETCGEEDTETWQTSIGPSAVVRVVDPTCTEDGGKYVGDNYTPFEQWSLKETYPALGHDWGEWTSDGTAKSFARMDEDTGITESSNDHTESRTCKRCQEKETKTVRDSYLSIIEKKLPTCAKSGYVIVEEDGKRRTILLGEKEHTFGKWKEKSRTSSFDKKTQVTTTTIVYERKCGACGATKKKTKKERSLPPITSTKTDPTCTKPGYETIVFGTETTREQIAPALGHDYSKWEVTKKATVNRKGTKVKKCSRCGKTITKAIPKLKATLQLSAKKKSVKAGKKLRIKAKMASGDKIVSWKSSNKKIAKVSKKGVVIGKKTGKVTITAKTKAGAKAKFVVKVK